MNDTLTPRPVYFPVVGAEVKEILHHVNVLDCAEIINWFLMRKINIDKYTAKASIYTGSGIYYNRWSIENPGNNKGEGKDSIIYSVECTVKYLSSEVTQF